MGLDKRKLALENHKEKVEGVCSALEPRPRGYKKLFMLYLTRHELYQAHKC